MKIDNGTKNIVAAIILGICILTATYIYAASNRYETTQNYRVVLDKWTGKTTFINDKR